jgi:hypothetical protein
LLQEAEITPKLAKCSLCAEKVQYLGFIVGRDGLRIDNSKLEAVRRAIPPRSKTPMRRVFGLTGVYRRFIEYYAKIAAPLVILKLTKRKDSNWMKRH